MIHAQGSEAITFSTGRSTMIVYRSQYAGTNKATAVNWMVGGEIEAIVEGLKRRGVTSSVMTCQA